MIYQRKPAPMKLGVYGVAVRPRTGVAPPRNVRLGRFADGDSGVNPQFDPQTDLNAPDRLGFLRRLRLADGDCGVSPQFDPQTDLNFPDQMSGMRLGFLRRLRLAGGRRMSGLRFHGFGASFGDDTGYTPWDITQTYTDTTSPYATTPQDSGPSTPATSTDIPTGNQQNTMDFNQNLQNNPAADVAANAGASTSTQNWFSTGGQAAKSTFDVVGGILKTFGIGGGNQQGTGGPQAKNSMISITVLGAVVLGAGALYLASSRKKA